MKRLRVGGSKQKSAGREDFREGERVKWGGVRFKTPTVLAEVAARGGGLTHVTTAWRLDQFDSGQWSSFWQVFGRGAVT